MGTKLDVMAAVGDSFAALTQNFGAALRLALPWMLLVGVLTYVSMISIASSVQVPTIPAPEPAIGLQVLNFAVQMFAGLAGAIVAVAWHRKLLVGEQAMMALPNGYTLRYIGVMLLLALAIFAPIMLLGAFAGVIAAASGSVGMAAVVGLLIGILAIAAMVFGLRLSLVLPARAVGDTSLRLRDSWALTKGNTWRLIGGTLLAAIIPATVVNLAILPFTFGAMPKIEPGKPNMAALEAWMQSLALPSALVAMGYMLVSMIGIGFLSFAYRHFRGTQPPSV